MGLRNPGTQYANTRHNAGAWCVDRLAQRYGADWSKAKKGKVEIAEFEMDGQSILLAKPSLYMNQSGEALQPLIQYHRIPMERLWVAHDELDLAPNTVKVRQGGGAGGHNGLRDIISRMGSNFHRIRLGIGHPGHADAVSGYVLSRPQLSEREAIERSIDRFENAFPYLIQESKYKEGVQLLHHKGVL